MKYASVLFLLICTTGPILPPFYNHPGTLVVNRGEGRVLSLDHAPAPTQAIDNLAFLAVVVSGFQSILCVVIAVLPRRVDDCGRVSGN